MASLTINAMREYILNAYPDARPSWRKNIADTSNTRQIVAIYHRIQEKEEKEKQSGIKPKVEEYHQVDIYEYLASLNKKGSTTKIEV